jgi:hypothetical protein
MRITSKGHEMAISILLLCLLCLHSVSGAMLSYAEPKKDPDPECTVTNPSTGEFFDLRPLVRRDKEKYQRLVGGQW